jgi:hypothetical protein
MRRQILGWMMVVALALMSHPLYAETRGDVPIKRATESVAAKVTIVSGNLITISDGRGRTKTLELYSTQGLEVGTPTGWCEEDCGKLKIGDQTIRVKRVIQ